MCLFNVMKPWLAIYVVNAHENEGYVQSFDWHSMLNWNIMQKFTPDYRHYLRVHLTLKDPKILKVKNNLI